MKYDGVLSLGTFCQMGAALWMYELKYLNTPFDHFGIKSWTSVIDILNSDFQYYWHKDNLGVGKVVEEMSLKHNMAQKRIYKVYDNKYNLVSNHNFLENENPNGDLLFYDTFINSLKRVQKAFINCCENYENVRFVMKVMNWPNPEDTVVKEEDILRLYDALERKRNGKYFDLHLLVPRKAYENLKSLKFDKNICLQPWDIAWNNEKHAEWESILGDVEISDNQWETLVGPILGDLITDISTDLPCLNNLM